MFKIRKGNLRMSIFKEEDAKEYLAAGWKLDEDETPIVEETKEAETEAEEKDLVDEIIKPSNDYKKAFRK